MDEDKGKERNPNAATPGEDPNRQGRGPAEPEANQDLPEELEPGRGPDREDLPDTEASPDTDVQTTDAAIEAGAPDSSGAVDKDAGR